MRLLFVLCYFIIHAMADCTYNDPQTVATIGPNTILASGDNYLLPADTVFSSGWSITMNTGTFLHTGPNDVATMIEPLGSGAFVVIGTSCITLGGVYNVNDRFWYRLSGSPTVYGLYITNGILDTYQYISVNIGAGGIGIFLNPGPGETARIGTISSSEFYSINGAQSLTMIHMLNGPELH